LQTGKKVEDMCPTSQNLEVLPVDLPAKHGRGGQSSLRFARLRIEKQSQAEERLCALAVQGVLGNGSSKSKPSTQKMAGYVDHAEATSTGCSSMQCIERLLRLGAADGSFQSSSEFWSVVDVCEQAALTWATQHCGFAVEEQIVATVVALAFLEKNVGQHRQTWLLAAEKSKMWLAKQESLHTVCLAIDALIEAAVAWLPGP